MHKWYSIACAYGASPLPPPTLTLNQFNTLRRYAAESDYSMSHLFDAVLTELRNGKRPLAGETVANMEKGLGKKPPTSPTINVYTKDSVIHNVPANKLTEMGPETLASVVAITDEMPWSESRVAAFKKEQGKRLEEAAAAKATKEKAERARALNVNEDVWSCGSEAETRRVNASDPGWVAMADLKALLERLIKRNERLGSVTEELDGPNAEWPQAKIIAVNAQIAHRAETAKKAKRKEQIDVLVSKLLKERNEL
jgi:hypothetical protein